MNCRICGTTSSKRIFSARISDFDVSYFDCLACGYVQTQPPHWLTKAYSSPINSSDTGIIVRNQSNINLVIATILLLNIKHNRVIDYSGGYGILVRMLRDVGIHALWSDPYSENLVARGFEHQGESGALITAFEAFEHFSNPKKELESIFTIAPNALITTTLIPNPAPPPTDWWYYGLEHGQHVGFFRVETLRHIARRHDKYLLTDGKSCHLFTDKKYSAGHWFALQIIARICRPSLLLGLKSRTWDDHLEISRNLKK